MEPLGELTRCEAKKVWAHEAHDFTPWLAANLKMLGDLLGKDLERVEEEASAGSFSLDILAKDLGTGHNVVIENQLEQTDHDHLGKVLTYAAHFDAHTVVWVTPTFRDEHIRTLDWLNRNCGEDVAFFGVSLEVIKIDDSKPAPLLRLAAFPPAWKPSKSGRSAPESGRWEAYRQFFQILIDRLREKHRFTGAKVAQAQNWYSFASGMPGISYGFTFALGGRARVEIYIDYADADVNQRILDAVSVHKDEIEKKFGEGISFEPLESKRACRISLYRNGSIEDPPETLDEIREWAIDRLLKSKAIIGPIVKKVLAEMPAQ